jgi:hypothetical protein
VSQNWSLCDSAGGLLPTMSQKRPILRKPRQQSSAKSPVGQSVVMCAYQRL